MPVARILFPLPLPEPFDYAVPEGLDVAEGSYVTAPLGKHERLGIVVEILGDEAGEGRTLKAVSGVYPTPPMSRAMQDFLGFAARYTVLADDRADPLLAAAEAVVAGTVQRVDGAGENLAQGLQCAFLGHFVAVGVRHVSEGR